MRVLMISRQSLFTVPGGDTVQVVETAKSLRRLGVEVDIKLAHEKIDYSSYDLLHFFNIIRPNFIGLHIKKSALPFVISTIFVDYSQVEKYQRGRFFSLLSKLISSDGMNYLKTLGRVLMRQESLLDWNYLLKGHKRSVIELLNQAAILLPNSKNEYQRLKQAYKFKNRYKVIPNAAADEYFQECDLSEKEGVICVARIEVIKNQLNLIRAVKDADIKLKIIGKAAPNHHSYYQKCKLEAGENVEFLGQMEKDELIREMRKAKVHVLPSFFETTGLSSLEAAASCCNIVVTPNGDTVEYFQDKATYCDPNDIISIRNALHEAHEKEVDLSLKQRVNENFRWSKTAKRTKEAYEEVLSQMNAA